MAQAPVTNKTCELCDQSTFNWKCIECNQYICSKCKKIHGRSSATRKHQVVEVTETPSVSPYKTTCATHKSKPYQLYCTDCLVLVCNKCITSTHECHKFCDVDVIVEEKKVQIEENIEDLRECLKKANNESELFQKEKRRTLKNFDTATKKLNDFVEKTIKEIDRCQDELSKEIENAKEKAETEFKTMGNRFERRKNGICCLINEIELSLQSDDNLRIVHSQSVLNEKINAIPSEIERIPIPSPKFLPVHDKFPIQPEILLGKLEFEQTVENKPKRPSLKKTKSTQSMMSTDSEAGHVVVTTIKHSFQIETIRDGNIGCIAVSNDNEAWVACPYDKNVTLVRRNGILVKEIPTDFNISDICVNNSGDLLLSSAESNQLKIISSGEINVQDFVDTFPSQPHGVSVTKNGEILLCLTNGDFGQVTRLSERGKILKEYDTYIANNQSYLFRKPVRCIESLNGNLWILDEMAKKIVVLDKDGQFQLEWNGPSMDPRRRRIEPSGLDCDDNGNILVTDYDNDSIYVIYPERNQTELLQIVEKKHPVKDPYGIAIHADKFVWVGCDDGVMHVMRYRRDPQ